MAKHYLNRPKIGAALDHVSGGGVAKSVRRNGRRVDSDPGSMMAHDAKRRLSTQATTATIEK